MFRRKPAFLPIENCSFKTDNVFAESKSFIKQKNKAYVKSHDINWDNVVAWQGMPVKIKNKKLGFIGQIAFDEKKGNVKYIELSEGVLSGVVLGNTRILSEDIAGYSSKEKAIILKEEAKIYERKDGLADKAGKGASVVVHTVKSKSPKVVDAIQDQSDKIHKMFAEFKDEFKKGMQDK